MEINSSYESHRGRRRWSVLLFASLTLNLFIGGTIATRLLDYDGSHQFMAAGYAQLIPRRFLVELPIERRKELLAILGPYLKDFRAERQGAESIALNLAQVLTSAPNDAEKIKLLVNEFTSQSARLAVRGGDAAFDVISRLSPDERKALANSIHELR
jgi:hypothetical protein